MSGYRTLRVSDETAFDLVRALWLADEANGREGVRPAKLEARQAEAFGRIVREWSAVAVTTAQGPDFDALCRADWRCEGCGSTGLNAGGLEVSQTRVLCRQCR